MISGKEIIDKLKEDIWHVIRAVFTANRDYPYHDYETATLTSTYKPYAVGDNNKDKHGSQSKLFVSKDTLIYSTVEADVKFNDAENVEIDILANTYYTFRCNISRIFYKYSSEEGTIYIWCDGVLPQEVRSSE